MIGFIHGSLFTMHNSQLFMACALTLGGFTFLMAVIWGSPLVELMRRLRLGAQIRIDGPQTHLQKMGTPAKPVESGS